METLTLEWIAHAANGKLRQAGRGKRARGVSTDSRTIRHGELFVALAGERFDGHRFVEQVAQRGAAGALVHRDWAAAARVKLPLIVVGDTLAALQALARAYRRRLKLRVIAVTGSNGKTTTKEAIAAVMNKKFDVVKSEGNLNNHIGVPLSVLQADPSHEVGVFELGINHPGELAPLVEICEPQVGVLTNIGQTHLEFFGDEAGVAQEKGKLLEALTLNGLAVLNADDRWTNSLRERTDARVTTVGFAAEADVRADNIHWERGKLCFDLHFDQEADVPQVWFEAVGQHQIYSALFAAAVAREFGLGVKSVAQALKRFRPPADRLRVETIRGVRLINDTYNANLDSMIASLRTLASLPRAKRRIATLGDMAELGKASERSHLEVGEVAAKSRLDQLLLVGEQARLIGEAARKNGFDHVTHFTSAAAAGKALAKLARRGDAILVKASRATKLEETVEIFRKSFGRKG